MAVVTNRAEIDRLLNPRTNPRLKAALMVAGKDIEGKARRAAPVRKPRSQGGAKSIEARFSTMAKGEIVVKIAWDKKHFYMSFQEFGTVRLTPRAFLLRAVSGYLYTRYGKSTRSSTRG